MVEKIKREDLFKLEKEYIFHGSPVLFEVGKPHQAKCDSRNALNEQNAIYGANDIRFAIIFAFEKLPREHFSWSAVNKNGKYTAELRGDTYIDKSAKGYLYCFDKSKFNSSGEGASQYVCYEELRPLKIFELDFKDYADLFVYIDREKTF